MNSDNKLASATSPYLAEHSKNLVNWYPWDQEALDLAAKQEKPILLSIGYQTCHWCKVMMEESFCDPDIAATMNRLFINILVDKEERPDLDRIYQTAHQLLMGNPGGWPLTMFLSPSSLIPYFGGTYFAKDEEDEIPSFNALLHGINEVFYKQREKIAQQEAQTNIILQIITQPRPASDSPPAQELFQRAQETLGEEFDAKNGGFGDSAKFPCCPILDFLLNSEEKLVRHMAISSLEFMAERDIYDKTNGGFFRYTLDPEWQKPHLEKTLFDNSQLLALYAKAYSLTHDEKLKEIALETGNWIITTLRSPKDQGFFAGTTDDNSVLDLNIITSWNALAAKSLAISGKYLDTPKHQKIAKATLDLILEGNNLRFLDDYAYLIDALLYIDPQTYTQTISELIKDMVDNFFDQEEGGFYFTANTEIEVMFRPKIYADEATPSGNGLACLALLQSGKVDLVKQTFANAQAFLNEAPELHVNMLRAYALLHEA